MAGSAKIGALKKGALAARELPRGKAIEAELEPFCKLWAGDEHQRLVEDFLEDDEEEL